MTSVRVAGNAVAEVHERYADLPTSIREARRWLLWRYEANPNGGKALKVPYYHDGSRRRGAQGTDADRSRMSSFEVACAALATGRYTGLGFALGPDGTGNHWQGIDLDSIPSRPHLQLIADDLPGYTEASPSGTGMHAIGYGQAFGTFASNSSGVEAYSLGQFFTVTGEVAGLADPVDLAEFVAERIVPVHETGAKSKTEGSSASDGSTPTVLDPMQITHLRSALAHLRSDDRDIWMAIRNNLKCLGDVGRGLWIEWAQMSDAWQPSDARKWDEPGGDRSDYRAVFNKAKTAHWVNPMSAVAMPGVPPLQTAANDAGIRRSISFTRADKIERKATDWLIRGYLVRDTLAGLIAKPGACKSFLAVDWACRVATGTEWFGRHVTKGAVFYLAGEGQRGLRKRIDGWEKANGTSLDGAPLFIASGMPSLCDLQDTAAAIRAIQETVDEISRETGDQPALIVVDTVARAMNGANENSTEDMGKLIASLDMLRRAWGATVLTVHHTGHDPNTQGRARGSSNYGASLDSDFYLSSKDDTVSLTSGEKAKDWRKPEAVALTKVEVMVDVLGEDGETVQESTLTLHDSAGAVIASSKRERAEALKRAGHSVRDIAVQIGVSKSTVGNWLKAA